MSPLRAPTRAFLAASAFSSFGNGLTFPVGALYLVRVRALAIDSASVFFVAMAIAGAIASLAFGGAMDRVGPRRFVAFGMLSEATGLVLFAHASSFGTVLAAGAAIGCGNGLFFTGLTPLLASLETGAALERAFSVRYWFINLGSSIGALVGGSIVAVAGEHALTTAYLANAATSVVLAGTLALVPLGTRPAETASPRGVLRWNGTLFAVVAANGLVVVFGVAMFEAVVPYVFVRAHEGALPLAHVIVGASTVAIAILQLPLGRWSERRSKARVLVVHSAIWALAAGVGLLAVGATGGALWALGIAYGVVFGVGECLFAAGLSPLVVRVVPPMQLGRFNGILSASFSVALAAGPALGFSLAGHVSPYAFWVAVAGAMMAAMSLWSYVERGVDHEG